MNPANAWLLLTTRSPGVSFIPGGWGTIRPSDVAQALGGLDRAKFLMGMAALAGDRSQLAELVNVVWLELIHPAAAAGEWKIKRGAEQLRRLAALVVFESLHADDAGRGRCYVCNGQGRFEAPPETRGVPAWMASLRKADLPPAPSRDALRKLIRREKRLRMMANQVEHEFNPKELTPRDRDRLNQLLKWADDLARRTAISKEPGACDLCAGSGTIRWEGRHRAWLVGLSEDHWYRVWASRYSPLQAEIRSWISDCLTHVGRKLARTTERAA